VDVEPAARFEDAFRLRKRAVQLDGRQVFDDVEQRRRVGPLLVDRQRAGVGQHGARLAFDALRRQRLLRKCDCGLGVVDADRLDARSACDGEGAGSSSSVNRR
jgi:hypothetical protein